jgi:hypothetical protein
MKKLKIVLLSALGLANSLFFSEILSMEQNKKTPMDLIKKNPDNFYKTTDQHLGNRLYVHDKDGRIVMILNDNTSLDKYFIKNVGIETKKDVSFLINDIKTNYFLVHFVHDANNINRAKESYKNKIDTIISNLEKTVEK